MQPDKISRNERIDEVLANASAARRRERAFFRAPVTSPSRYPKQDLRRIAAEVKEELLRRG